MNRCVKCGMIIKGDMMDELIIGSHVSYNGTGGLAGCVIETLKYGANTFMFYTGAPQNTVRADIDMELTDLAHKTMKEQGIDINNVIVLSDEESKLLNDLVALSGLTKQDYITRRLLCRDVVVQGNPRVYKALKNQMAAIYEELKRLEALSPDNDELLYTLQVIAITLDGLKGEDE